MRLDYCVVITGQGQKFIAELKIHRQLDFEPYIAQTSDAIQRVLRKSKAHAISTMFQQEMLGVVQIGILEWIGFATNHLILRHQWGPG